MVIVLDRTKTDPWLLKTPPGTSDFTMHVDEKDGRRILVCTVGGTVLRDGARFRCRRPRPRAVVA